MAKTEEKKISTEQKKVSTTEEKIEIQNFKNTSSPTDKLCF